MNGELRVLAHGHLVGRDFDFEMQVLRLRAGEIVIFLSCDEEEGIYCILTQSGLLWTPFGPDDTNGKNERVWRIP